MRRIIALLLCAGLLAALAAVALAETMFDSGVQGNISWKIVGRPEPLDPDCTMKVLVVSGSGAMQDYDDSSVYCPGDIHPAWFKDHGGSEYGANLRGIEIGSGITHIGRNAFSPQASYVNSIAEVVIPDTVISIGAGAFLSQAHLYRVVIPDSVAIIGDKAFHTSTTIVCSSTSQAYRYAQRAGNPVSLTDVRVTLDRKSIALEVGEKAVLGATVSVEGMSPTFCTDDSDVAGVDTATGEITARSAGSARILVFAGGEQRASCDVTVKAASVPATTAKPASTVAPTSTAKPAARLKEKITASNVTMAASATKKQSFAIGAERVGDGALTYSSDSKSVSVSSKGRVTVAKGFVGKATITIKSAKTKSYAAASKKITVTVKPGGAKLTSATSPKRGTVKLKWKKDATGAGYQIQYALSKGFTGAKTVGVNKNSTLTKTIGKLKAGKTYYVRVRSFKKVGATTYYSRWSDVKQVKTSR